MKTKAISGVRACDIVTVCVCDAIDDQQANALTLE